jgi:hypothetical protein
VIPGEKSEASALLREGQDTREATETTRAVASGEYHANIGLMLLLPSAQQSVLLGNTFRLLPCRN